jgi:hypothetical protein
VEKEDVRFLSIPIFCLHLEPKRFIPLECPFVVDLEEKLGYIHPVKEKIVRL